MSEVNPFPTVTLNSSSGSSAVVSLYGGMVTSWKVDQGELLSVSSQAQYKVGKAIRGGIPIIFPQFSNMGALPSHGFARTEYWKMQSSAENSVTLLLTDSPATKQVWDEQFRLRQTVAVEERTLRIDFEFENLGSKPVSFQFALHTYFRISDIRNVSVSSLDECSYLDNLDSRVLKTGERGAVRVSEEIDRVYLSPQQPIVLRDDGTQRTISLESNGLPDLVLWNPWIEKSKGIADLGDSDYLNFICLEAAAIKTPLVVSANSSIQFSHSLACA